ncbi:uncharacterized protein LOC110459297 [Mizuhopecten yessoensis]|uniref:uncharacterized protein LOC110459297 n=1 Tax=Mizuhopecten yessoensis TaxID=6573 RepID=UPI000B45EFE4|nr:uncharacterized protein LOC110459297 [Mizuhopecten yessoensis]XP_021367156.1 uncharacterized protein LOC110459297 [Mizuhopecten yessoensis]
MSAPTVEGGIPFGNANCNPPPLFPRITPQAVETMANSQPLIHNANNVNLLKKSKLPTPIKVQVFLTHLAGYPQDKFQFLKMGFTEGFSLQYYGSRRFRTSKNLKSALDNVSVLKQKIEKEISLGRIQGPFQTPPFPNLQVSPLGLVPKKELNEFRVIHHLSYPQGTSINDGINPEDATVAYQTIDDAVRLVKHFGRGSLMAKTDIESAFRLIPIHPTDYELLGFQIDDKFYFDKVLPMGCSISCRLFEAFSSAIHWIMETKYQVAGVVHILDDFLFVAPPGSSKCMEDLANFLTFCQHTQIPIKQSKTVNPCTQLTFLGIELDSSKMEARLPMDKIIKMRQLLDQFSRRRKVTLRELQSLIGLLNFACKVISPGRTFLRRLINLTCGLQKPHHHVRLSREARADIAAWKVFIDSFNGVSMFLDDRWVTTPQLQFFTDASNRGFGAIFNTSWLFGTWPASFTSYHITVKEFFAIVLAIEIWGPCLRNRCLLLYCDNMAVVDIINKQTSKDSTLMALTRRFVITSLRFNILFSARHIPGKSNILADHLSRLQVELFQQQAPHMERHSTPVPDHLLTI